MNHFVIVGPQGAGKGTQAALLVETYDLVHLSTGDIFRSLMATTSDLAEEVRQYVDEGRLVPDDLTARVLFSRLDAEACAGELAGALFDGYPRNAAQSDVLDKSICERGDHLVGVVHIDVPIEVLRDRIALRAEREGRSDDTPEALERRLQIYFDSTEPLLQAWRTRGILVDINGDQSIEEVASEVRTAVDALLGPAEEESPCRS